MNSSIQLQQFQDVRNNLTPIIDSLVAFFQNDCSSGDRRSLDFLVFMGIQHPSINCGQQRIASNASLSRQHLNTRLKKLANHLVLDKFRLLAKQYRHRKTCVYYLTSLFDHPEIRRALIPFLPALRQWTHEKYLEFSLFLKHLTPSNEDNNYIVSNSCKRVIFGDKVNKEFKNMAARSEHKAKKEAGPPPLSRIDREIKEKERDLREAIALRSFWQNNAAKKQTTLTPEGARWLKECQAAQAFGATVIDREAEETSSPPVESQTCAFPKTG